MVSLPAVLIGGPPHSGKSVLLYSLSQALRAVGVEHYALRACPDGEGDWANEAQAGLVRTIRIKGEWTDEWVESICRDIEGRHLPLLVDMGGRPTLEQERIFELCTGAILLTKDTTSHAEWLERIERNGLPLLADLTSRLDGTEALISPSPIVSGVVAGLERHEMKTGLVFETLVAKLAEFLDPDGFDYRQYHLATAPVELAIDLDRLAVTLDFAEPDERIFWQPDQLIRLLDYLPSQTALAAYGRGTNWVQSALACLAYPADYYSFDIRLGWVRARRLPLGVPADDSIVRFDVRHEKKTVLLDTILPQSYLDYRDLDQVTVPDLGHGHGIILSGKIPYWLITSLVITYIDDPSIDLPFLAIYQPHIEGAVVVYTQSKARIGDLIPVG